MGVNLEIVNIVWGLISFTIYIILRLLQLELSKVNIEFLYQWKNQNLEKEEVIEQIFKKQELFKNAISVFSIIFLIICITELQYIFLIMKIHEVGRLLIPHNYLII